MNFENYSGLTLFDEFTKLYNSHINEMKEVKQSSIYKIKFVSEDSSIMQAHYFFDFSEKDFFFKCFINKAPIIGCNKNNCEIIKLSEIECFAMIAHELGHIYLVPNTEEDLLKKELLADEMSCRLGLKEGLISGLKKIADYEYCLNNEEILQRISLLSNGR